MRRLLSVALVVAGGLTALGQAPPAQPNKPATESQKPAPEASQPAKTSSANPFPEDTSTVPVMPSISTSAPPEGSYSGAAGVGLPLPGDDLDPVRSPEDPEPAATTETEDSSSSQTGLERLLPKPEDDPSGKKKKLFVKEPTHQEAASKDIEIGNYYLDRKNWKAALSRFESALVLDPENPDVYWGLAEAQHHLGDLANAKANYLKLLDYDPDGPHGRQARKELKDPALSKAPGATQGQPQSESQK